MRARRIVALVGLLLVVGVAYGTTTASAATGRGLVAKHDPQPSPSTSTSSPQPQYPTTSTSSPQHRNGGSQDHNKHRAPTPSASPVPTPSARGTAPATPSPSVSRGVPGPVSAYWLPSSDSSATHHATTTTTTTTPVVAPASHRPDVARDTGPTDLLSAAFSRTVPKVGAFPAGLLIAALLFLALQGRLDRSDTKLALAKVATDDGLEFGAPPSRRTDEAATPQAIRVVRCTESPR